MEGEIENELKEELIFLVGFVVLMEGERKKWMDVLDLFGE